MKTISPLILITCFSISLIHAQQYDNHIWLFGNSAAGIRFDTLTNQPTQYNVKASPYATIASAVAVHSRTNELLFYSDGEQVFDFNHRSIASGLKGHPHSVQTEIIKKPCGCDEYLIFSNTAHENGVPGGGALYGTLVQIREHRVYVPLITKALLIEQSVNEGIVLAKKPNSEDFWIVGIKSSGQYFVMEYSCDGPGETVLFDFSNEGASLNPKTHNIKYHAQSGKIAIAYEEPSAFVGLLDFDPAAGRLSNFASTYTTVFSTFDMEWSPGGGHLYIANYQPGFLWQIDFSNNIRHTIYSGGRRGGGLRLGPDGKVYHITDMSSSRIARIHNPDLTGNPCNHLPDDYDVGVPIEANSFGATYASTPLGFPDPFNLPKAEPTCAGQDYQLETNGFGWLDYRWTGPNGFILNGPHLFIPEISDEDTGWYIVTASYEGCEIKDSVWVPKPILLPEIDLGEDQILCEGETVEIGASFTDAQYLWQDGFTGKSQVGGTRWQVSVRDNHSLRQGKRFGQRGLCVLTCY